MQNYLEAAGQWVVNAGLRILLVLVLMMVAVKAARVILDKLFRAKKDDVEMKKRIETLHGIAGSSSVTVIFIVAGMMILEKLGISIGPLLATAGVVGLAVGFGAQELVKDLIGGFFILLEDQVRVGDFVEIGSARGLAEKVNLRMVVLRDPAGNVHYIRSGSIDKVTNMTKEYSRHVFDIGVAYREDTDEVVEVIRQIDRQLRDDLQFKEHILEPIEILGVDGFTGSAVIVKARTKTKPGKQRLVGREFNRRLKKKFDELGIEIPFPHRTLYIGKDKKNNSSRLNISVKK